MRDLLVKVAEHYTRLGDPIGAGLQVAWLTDKKMWYMAVHRFTTRRIESRMVVAKATHADMDACLRLLEMNWNNIVLALAELDMASARDKETQS